MESKKQNEVYSLEQLYNKLVLKNLELDKRLKKAEEDLIKEKERSFSFNHKMESINNKIGLTSPAIPKSLKKLNKTSFN